MTEAYGTLADGSKAALFAVYRNDTHTVVGKFVASSPAAAMWLALEAIGAVEVARIAAAVEPGVGPFAVIVEPIARRV